MLGDCLLLCCWLLFAVLCYCLGLGRCYGGTFVILVVELFCGLLLDWLWCFLAYRCGCCCCLLLGV